MRTTDRARAAWSPLLFALAAARGTVAAAATPILLAVVSLLISVTAPGDALAHLGNISYADFKVRGGDVLLSFKYAVHVTPGIASGAAAPTTRAEVLGLQGSIENWLRDNSEVRTAGKPCMLSVDNMVGPDRDMNLVVLAVWTCGVAEIKGLTINFHPLDAVMPDWQTIASMNFAGHSSSTVFTPDAASWQIGDAAAIGGSAASAGTPVSAPAVAPPPAGNVAIAGNASAFSSFFALGVKHIWTGYDHLLFLLAVLLAGGGIARLAAIVTSFTIAHSITLGAAATGLVHLPVAPVEAAIALSIVYVAAENLLDLGADRRAFVTFGFGLIHGFGFASVLAQTALPTGGILVPLLAFNVGVEAGQLAVVAVVVPLLTLVMRGPHARRIKTVLSTLIACAGAAWAIQRIAAIVG